MCIDHALNLGDLSCGIHEAVLLGDLDDFGCYWLPDRRLLRAVKKCSIYVGKEVAERFGVFGSVLVDTNFAGVGIRVHDVLEQGLFESHGAAELLPAGSDCRLQADHVAFEVFGPEHALDQIGKCPFHSAGEKNGECIVVLHAESYEVDDLLVPASFPSSWLFYFSPLSSCRQYTWIVPPASIV